MVPEERRKDEKDKAFKTVGDLELWLFLGVVAKAATWEKLIVQPGGHTADIEHGGPYMIPTTVG